MREKLTLEKFREIKKGLIGAELDTEKYDDIDEYVDEIDDALEETLNDFDNPFEYYDILKKHMKLQNELLSYDLSNIPAEEWKNVALLPPFWDDMLKAIENKKQLTEDDLNIINNNETVDLSNTNANIDFKIFNTYTSDKYNFSSCNTTNLHKLYREKYFNFIFDDKTIEENQHIFLSNNFSDDQKKKLYTEINSLKDIVELPEELQNEIYFKYNIADYINIYSYEDSIFGLKDCIKNFGVFISSQLLKNHNQEIDFNKYFYQQDLENITEIIKNDKNISNKIQEFYLNANDINEIMKVNKFFPINNYQYDKDKMKYLITENFNVIDVDAVDKAFNIKELFNDEEKINVLKSYFNDIDVDEINKVFNIKELFNDEEKINVLKLYFNGTYKIDSCDKLKKVLENLDFQKIENEFNYNDIKIFINSFINNLKGEHYFDRAIKTIYSSNLYNVIDLKKYLDNETINNIVNKIEFVSDFENLLNVFSFNDDQIEKIAQRCINNAWSTDDLYQLNKITPIYNLLETTDKDILSNIINKDLKRGYFINLNKFNEIYPLNNIQFNYDLIKESLNNAIINDISVNLALNSLNNILKDNIDKYIDSNVMSTHIKKYLDNDKFSDINNLNKEINIYQYIDEQTIKSTFIRILSDSYFIKKDNLQNVYDLLPQNIKSEINIISTNKLYDLFLSKEIRRFNDLYSFFEENNINFVDYLSEKQINSLKMEISNDYSIIETFNNSLALIPLLNDECKLFVELSNNFDSDNSINIFNNWFFNKTNHQYFTLENIRETSEIVTYMGDYNKKNSINILNFITQNDNLDKNLIYKLIDIGKTFNNDNILQEAFQEYTIRNLSEDNIKNAEKWCKKLTNYSISKDNLQDILNFIMKNNHIAENLLLTFISEGKNFYNDPAFQKKFQNEIINQKDNIRTEENIKDISNIFIRCFYSNSSEFQRIKEAFIDQLLFLKNNNIDVNTDDILEKSENIFLKNNIPFVGKAFTVFQILHPNLEGFDFNSGKMCPTFKNKSNLNREITIFSDLLKSAVGSNNRSIKEYLDNMKKGNALFLSIAAGQIKFDELEEKNQNILKTYVNHLNTLYENTNKGKKENIIFDQNIEKNINQLLKEFSTDGNFDYNLPDRIVKMFGHFAGFDKLDDLLNYIDNKTKFADKRNREAANKTFKLEKDDFVKGFGIEYLSNILQNGSVAREFLGDSADSDLTPLDTDLSIVLRDNQPFDEFTSKYGNHTMVLKSGNRFAITRRSPSDENQSIVERVEKDKIEAFYTGENGDHHYGIRTGFASSEIDYFMVYSSHYTTSNYAIEITKNGFYIPVVDGNGKLLFTPQQYDLLREKMNGLSYYGIKEYKLSNNLVNQEVLELVNQIENNDIEVKSKRDAILKTIQNSINENNLIISSSIGNLTEGIVELIDTGSTGRGTNMPGDGDFDFMMKLDKKIISNEEQLNIIKNNIKNSFNSIAQPNIYNGNFRFKGVSIDGLEQAVDIDITFTNKTDKVNYSTDMCVKDRLNSIKEQHPDQYNLVVANILLAKKVLKNAKAYKPERGNDNDQGGLGGVGIENWILQNGGSFEDAAKDFLKASENKDFNQFQKDYEIWDFGKNHVADRYGRYHHDNFVNNMNSKGYEKMKEALKNYLSNINTNKIDNQIDENSTYKTK